MDFFGLGAWEILVILVVAMLIFGPGKLPEVGRTIGRAVREFRKATSSVTAEVTRELEVTESSAELKKLGRELKEVGASVQPGQILPVESLAKELRDARQDLERPQGKGTS